MIAKDFPPETAKKKGEILRDHVSGQPAATYHDARTVIRPAGHKQPQPQPQPQPPPLPPRSYPLDLDVSVPGRDIHSGPDGASLALQGLRGVLMLRRPSWNAS